MERKKYMHCLDCELSYKCEGLLPGEKCIPCGSSVFVVATPAQEEINRDCDQLEKVVEEGIDQALKAQVIPCDACQDCSPSACPSPSSCPKWEQFFIQPTADEKARLDAADAKFAASREYGDDRWPSLDASIDRSMDAALKGAWKRLPCTQDEFEICSRRRSCSWYGVAWGGCTRGHRPCEIIGNGAGCSKKERCSYNFKDEPWYNWGCSTIEEAKKILKEEEK